MFEFELLRSRNNFCWFEFEWLGCVPFNFSGCSNSNAAWASELILLNFGNRIHIRRNFELEESRIYGEYIYTYIYIYIYIQTLRAFRRTQGRPEGRCLSIFQNWKSQNVQNGSSESAASVTDGHQIGRKMRPNPVQIQGKNDKWRENCKTCSHGRKNPSRLGPRVVFADVPRPFSSIFGFLLRAQNR